MSKIKDLSETISSLQEDLNGEIDKTIIVSDSDNTPADMSARYWLMQFLEPLSRKELKSVVDGFLVQLLNDEQSKKLVKFLMSRFPNYYKKEMDECGEETPELSDIKFHNE